MAKATAYCKCKICGNEFIRTTTRRNRTEADSWEEWAIRNFDLCPKCYYNQQRELEKAKGLYVDIYLNSQSMLSDSILPIAIVFGGDTMQNKDAIKALGAIYTRDYPSEGVLGDLFMMRASDLRWVLNCSTNELQSKIEQINNIGAKINSVPSDNDIALYNQIMSDKQNKSEKVLQAELDVLGNIPSWPEDIAELWPEGAKWNGKFYGKSKLWRVYFSGEEVHLTDKQKEEMEKIQKKRQLWREKKKEIENRYK